MPGSVVAGAVSTIFFLVVTFQPRDSTLPTWSAAVTAARSRMTSWRAWSTKALWSPSVWGEGAPEAGFGLTNRNFPLASTYITMLFSSASRARKSQSVTLDWLMNP